MTNAVFMPYVLAFNRDAIEDKIARLAAYCGIKGGFDGFQKAILKLRKELKVPHTLPDFIKGLETGEYFEFHGEFYDIPKIKMSPAPTEHIPLLVGGHADLALKRAVRRGDGWMHGGGTPEELDALLAKLAGIRKAEGKEDDPFEIHVISMDAYTVDGCKRLEDKGITDVIVGFRMPYIMGPDTEPLQKKIDHLNWYGENLIAKVNG